MRFPCHFKKIDIAEGRIHDDSSTGIAVVGLHAGMSPHHIFMSGIHFLVILIVNVLPALYGT